MVAALDAAGGPVLAYCRSGTRSCNLWALASATAGSDPAELVTKGAGAAVGPVMSDYSATVFLRTQEPRATSARPEHGQGWPVMNWMQLGGSIVAILLLAGVARMLRLGESKIATAAEARRFAEEALVGFEARHALVGQDGNA
eukprot:gene44176-59832_t